MKRIFTPFVNGFILSNLFSLLLIGLTKYFTDSRGGGVLIFSEFVIIPFGMGIVSAWFWRDISFSSRRLAALITLNCAIAIALSAIFLEEGVICLIIVSPLLFAFLMAGTYAGAKMFNKNNTTVNVSIIAVLAIVFIADSLSTHNYQNKVSDELIINATPDEIWKHVVAFKRIKESNKYWLFKAGMPSPVQATVSGYYEGASRKCIFSNGYVFDEKIVKYEKNKDLTFDITHQPRTRR